MFGMCGTLNRDNACLGKGGVCKTDEFWKSSKKGGGWSFTNSKLYVVDFWTLNRVFSA